VGVAAGGGGDHEIAPFEPVREPLADQSPDAVPGVVPQLPHQLLHRPWAALAELPEDRVVHGLLVGLRLMLNRKVPPFGAGPGAVTAAPRPFLDFRGWKLAADQGFARLI